MNRVHRVGFEMFKVMVEKLLNIEQIFTENLLKSKLKMIEELGNNVGIP